MTPRRWQQTLLRLAGGALLVLLAGCAQQPLVLDHGVSGNSRIDAAWQAHETAVRQTTDWRCIGRIAIRTETEGGTVNLDWLQQDATARIVLNAPLNQGTVELIGRPDRMRITDSSGHREVTTPPEARIAQLTGWNIPITALPDWIRGLPHGRNAKIQLNHDGRLQHLADGGWQITYSSYRPVPGHDLYLPGKLTVSRDDIRLRLVVESWQIPDRKSAGMRP